MEERWKKAREAEKNASGEGTRSKKILRQNTAPFEGGRGGKIMPGREEKDGLASVMSCTFIVHKSLQGVEDDLSAHARHTYAHDGARCFLASAEELWLHARAR